MREEWRDFVGGKWETEVDVRDFIQKNYTPYDGDDSFLADATEATKKLWEQVMELSKQEKEAGRGARKGAAGTGGKGKAFRPARRRPGRARFGRHVYAI